MRRIVANNRASNKDWPTPKPIPNDLPPVDSFALDFMPVRLAPWINDIATRLQCPPDYPAITVITALGAVVGRKIGIKPQMKTDWLEIPNVWGAFIGPPGMLKSPAMNEALRPIHRLEAEAARSTEIARQAYAAGLDAFRLRKQVAIALARAKLKKTLQGEKHIGKIDLELGKQPQEPVPVRYRTNDTTYQALAELIANNPTGILVERDELVSLLRHLDRHDQAVARGFFLTGWSGTQPYTLDRITRGTRHIGAVCISVLGNSQPARIAEYVKRVNTNDTGGDGLLQRFGLMAWPNTHPDWKDVDRNPDSRAREDAWKVFDRLSNLDSRGAIALGARRGPSDSVPFFRLSAAAHDEYPSCAPGDSAKAAASRLLTGVNPILERVRELQAEQAARIARKIDISRERLARDLGDATDIARRAGNAGVMVSSQQKSSGSKVQAKTTIQWTSRRHSQCVRLEKSYCNRSALKAPMMRSRTMQHLRLSWLLTALSIAVVLALVVLH